ncbi:MAG: 6-phosphofructokinase [Anaerolineales bacterium]|nr:6-phosphofructokinase [Anaerolineales bacterium]
MRIGILTGGGDVPGLNACIKAFVYRCVSEGHEVVGLRRGWASLVEINPEDEATREEYTTKLDPFVVRTIDRTGGTFLHTSRTNPGRVAPAEVPEFLRDGDIEEDSEPEPVDLTSHALRVLEELDLDAIAPIGGDDTLSYALRLHNEGFPVVGIPKTMDNDVHGTDYCIGFSTAVTRSVNFIHALRTSTGSHERIAVVELFGRYSGETSLIAAYLSGVDRAIISEVPFNPERLAALLLQDKRQNPSNYAMMTISEGAQMVGGDVVMRGEADAYGHKKLGGIGAITGDRIKEITGSNILYQRLSYLMRSGSPDSLDLMVAINYAVMAADLAMEGRFGRMVALRDGIYTNVPLRTTGQGVKRVDVEAFYDRENYRPTVWDVTGKPMFLY